MDEEAVRRFLPKATEHAMKTGTEAILDVQSGNATMFVTPLLIGGPLMQRNPNLARMVVLQPPYALPSGGAARKDDDRRFAAFAEDWAKDFHASGRSRQAIVDSIRNVDSISAGLRGALPSDQAGSLFGTWAGGFGCWLLSIQWVRLTDPSASACLDCDGAFFSRSGGPRFSI